ncbi:MAG: exonuclease SbcC, partial [Labilithrix sp.]|nr:exonuclease SbcC [Labilithrix sp.]
RAADRWIDRRGGDARACRAPTATSAPRPGTYSVEPRAGAAPEAYLAFPFAAGDEKARAAASVVAAALEGEGGLLEKAFGGAAAAAAAANGNGSALARSWSARVLGVPRAPALVVRIVSTQATLDNAVMQARALVDRVKKGGLPAADIERATNALSREALAVALDPRARVVATWRGEPIPTAVQPFPRGKAGADDVRAFAAKYLAEDAMVVVAARPARVKATP